MFSLAVVYQDLESGERVEGYARVEAIDREAAIACCRAHLAINGCLLLFVS